MNGRPRVVVADDHPAMLEVLVRWLDEEFDVVAAVRDGEAAVTAVTTFAPDVAVLDIAMPVLDGLEAARRVLDTGSRVKVVFVTNLDGPEFVEGALALGDVGFVIKDRLVADLVPAVRTVLGGQSFLSPTLR